MERIALNPIQYKFWADDLLKYPAVEYNDTNCTFQVTGNLSLSALHDAYKQIMNEYPLFHSIIQVVNDQPFFQISDDFDVPLTVLEESSQLSDEEVKSIIEELVYRPFNLREEYPCRFYAIHVGAHWFLLHIFHHIVMDGLTFYSFCERLSVIYNLIAEKREVVTVNQLGWLNDFNSQMNENYKVNRSENLKYWLEYLADTPLTLSIPRTSMVKEEKGGAFSFFLGSKAYERCNVFCTQKKTTPFQLFSVVWSIVLAKTLGENRLVIDHTLHLRPKKYTSLLGVFVNNLPIKYVITDDASIDELISYTNLNRFKEYRHQHIFYSDIVHALARKQRDIQNINLFNVGINYPIQFRLLKLDLVDCTVTPFFYCNLPISNDLLLVIDNDTELSCRIRYSNKVSLDLVKSLAETFEVVLSQVLVKSDMKVGELNLISLDKQAFLLREEDNSLHSVKGKRVFLDWFKTSVVRYANKTAAVYRGKTISYDELDKQSDLVAKKLFNNVGRHRHIGLSMPKSLDMLIGILGILKSGNVYVPIDYNYPQSRIDFIVSDCNLDAVIVAKETPVHFAVKEFLIEDLLVECDIALSLSLPLPDDDAYIIYTSGSTGMPKGTPIKHYSLDITAWSNADVYQINDRTRILQFSSICFDVSIIEIFPAFFVGATLIIPTETVRKDITLLLELLKQENVTFAFIPPAIVSVMPHVDLPDLLTMMVAGEPTNPLAVKYWSKQCCLLNVYGPTESCGDSSVAVLAPDSCPNDIGRSMCGVTYYVLDKNLKLMPDYTIGELYIGGFKLTEGYINRPELNKEKFIENPYVSAEDKAAGINTRLYKSGDLVMRQKDGHLIFIGRADFQVKLHGYRIELGDVETKVMEYGHGIKNSVALVHEHGGIKHLVVYIQTDHAEDFELNQLKEFLRRNLPEYMLPSMIIPLSEFPYNTSGKVDRKRFPSPSFMHEKEIQEPPVTETEKKLAETWSVFLETASINRNDSFISLGGDSMAVIMLSFRIQEQFGIQIKASDIYSHITLNELADFIDHSQAMYEMEDQVLSVPASVHPSLASTQLSLWMQCVQSEDIKNAYNLPCIFKFSTFISVVAFTDAFNSLIRVQDSFRITFPVSDLGTPYIHVSDYTPIQVDVVPVDEVALREHLKFDMGIAFDLEKGPLYRCVLYRLPDGEYICSLVMHHLISDGWSAGLIRKVLVEAASGNTVDWDLLSGSYLSYATENNRFLQTESYRNRLDYWRMCLQDMSGLTLPVRNSSDGLDIAGGSYSLSLPATIGESVSVYCRTHSYTPFLFHCAVFLMLLSRISRQTNFVTGFPFWGREREKYNQVIGYFVHTLPLCFKDKYKDMSFGDYLSDLRLSLVDAEEHAISLNDIQNVFRTFQGSNVDTSLIQVMFAYEEDMLFYDYLMQEKSTFPLSLTILENEGHQYRCYWEYRRSCFDEDEIRQIADAYLVLLSEVLTDAEKRLHSYPISSQEYRNSIVALNTISVNSSLNQELFIDGFYKVAGLYSEHLAVVYDGEQINYQELDYQSSKLAFYVRTLQIPEKSRIGVCASSSIDCMLAILGIVKAGFSYVPIDIGLPDERKKWIASDAACALLLVDDDIAFFHDIPILTLTVGRIKELSFSMPEQTCMRTISATDEVYVIYTSGTTGQPKGIPVTHGALARLIKSEQEIFKLDTNSRVLQFAGISFDASVTEIFTTFFSGSTLVIANDGQRHDPELLVGLLESQAVTCATIPPALLPLLPHKRLPLLQTMIVGGESTAKSAIDWWSVGRRFINAYGPTENTVDTTVCIVDDTFEANDIGTPLPGVSCYVLDEHLNILPVGMPGELYIGGLQLTGGYINRQKLNDEIFVRNPYVAVEDEVIGINTRLYRSGDWVKRRKDGHFIFIGRVDNQVKLRGFRIELSEIESVLQKHESVQYALVLLLKDKEREELAAFVQPHSDAVIDFSALCVSLKSKLPSYMVPSKWALVEEFPLTVNGKIDRKRLPEPMTITNGNIVQAATTGESHLLKIAKEVLELEEIGVETDLLEAGMSSLQVMEFVMKAANEGYSHLTISSVYKDRTIRKLLKDCTNLLYFWANEYTPEKPLIVLFCGYPYFAPFYDDFIRFFSKDFSIFVFESHHESFLWKKDVSLDVLFESYAGTLNSVLKEKEIFAFTGYCMGSELAIAFANYLFRQHTGMELPRIINMEGVFERIKGEAIPYSEDKLVSEHRRITQKLTDDMPSLDYKGEIMNFLAANVSNRIFLEAGEETGPELIQKAHQSVAENQNAWKQHFPSAPYYLLDCDHWTFFREDNLQIVRKAIQEHWGV